MGETILCIAAHPDDEALGCGGTLAHWADQGANVHVAFLADGVGSRHGEVPNTTELHMRRGAAREACAALGLQNLPTFGDLPDNQLDAVPLLEVVQSVEALIERVQPDTVLTHHAGDLNIDHRRVHQAVMTACRPQRGHPVRTILCFEVASSTEWQPPGSGAPFEPSWFVDISATLPHKLAALDAYAAEMRDWPHPRSREGVEHLARWRGATVGCDAAEAFMLARALR
ncbi:MAG: PIG-L deacetylase family protein [Halothiobacillaceae bacterium]